MKGLKAFKSFTPGTDFKAWIFRILINTTLDHIRKRHREAHVNSEELSLVSPKGKDPISIATVMDLEDAFAQLPRDYRAVLTLVDIYGFTHKEAAEMLQCPIGTINSRLVRGRMMLRSKL
jgi:RNA polymerase sigma-70 factor (ECF subfamily)